MSQSELTAWALWVSETWYSGFYDGRNTKKFRLYAKARGIVVFDRALNGRTE